MKNVPFGKVSMSARMANGYEEQRTFSKTLSPMKKMPENERSSEKCSLQVRLWNTLG